DHGAAELELAGHVDRDVAEQRERRAERDRLRRVGGADERVRHDDRVRELVRVDDLLAEDRGDGVALADVGAAERLHRDDLAAEVDGRAVDGWVVDPAAPVEVGPAHQVEVEPQLDARVLDLADVLELRAQEALRGWEAHGDQRVERALVVVGEVDADAAAEQSGLEAGLDLAAAFRAERRVAELAGREAGLAVVAGDGVPGADGVERAGRAAGLADGGAELQRLPPFEGPELVVREDVGRHELRVGLEPEVAAERAVAVHAQARGDEQPVLPADGLLEEEAGVDDALPVVAGDAAAGGGLERRLAGPGELLGGHGDGAAVVREELAAPGERRGERAAERVVERADVVDREQRLPP